MQKTDVYKTKLQTEKFYNKTIWHTVSEKNKV